VAACGIVVRDVLQLRDIGAAESTALYAVLLPLADALRSLAQRTALFNFYCCLAHSCYFVEAMENDEKIDMTDTSTSIVDRLMSDDVSLSVTPLQAAEALHALVSILDSNFIVFLFPLSYSYTFSLCSSVIE
jgi:hypothetical protein